jgi:hypothetical protein
LVRSGRTQSTTSNFDTTFVNIPEPPTTESLEFNFNRGNTETALIKFTEAYRHLDKLVEREKFSLSENRRHKPSTVVSYLSSLDKNHMSPTKHAFTNHKIEPRDIDLK